MTSTQRILALAALALFSAATAQASSDALGGTFSADGVGARPVGLGGAFAALADDANATWANPAGMAFFDEHARMATFTHTNMYEVQGLTRDFVAYSQADEGSYGALGLSWHRFSANLDPETWTEDTFMYSGAKKLSGSGGMAWSLGWNLKYLRVNSGFSESDDTTTVGGGNATGYGADLGLMVKPRESLAVAVMVRDLYSTLSWDSRTMEVLPVTGIGGLSYRFTRNVALAAEGRMTQSSGGLKLSSLHGGAEGWLMDGKKLQWGFVRNFGLRGGYQQQVMNGDGGELAGGATVKADNWSLEYALQYPLTSGYLGLSHRLGLGFSF